MTINNFGLICVTGEQSRKLLQGQLTCNMDEVSPQNPLLAAHCNPQGRVISLFWVFQHQDAFYLLMPRESITTALNHLKKYAVFFKVCLTDVSSDAVPLLKELQAENVKIPDISAGIPAIYPETSEKFLPHELNLHNLKAISFNKGCYTGQEIIARMQYRGKLKNHLYRAQANLDTPPLRGTEILDATHPCGYLVDFAQVGYNSYELLLIAPEASVNTTPLFLDPDRKIILKFIA